MKENQHEQHEGNILPYFRQTILIMRLSLFFILVSTATAFSALTYSQNTKLSLNLKDATVKEVIKTIEDQSEFVFLYREGQINLNRRVSVHTDAKQLKEILDLIFEGTDNIYIISDRQVVIGKAPRKALEAQLSALQKEHKTVIEQPQHKDISGKVTDARGEPLPGATVLIKGTSIGTVTDVDGIFSLRIPVNAATLQVSFVGMKTQEIPVAGRTSFNVVLEEEAIGLEEVVAVGYGVQKKVNLTGSVASVQGELLTTRPVGAVGAGLQGLLPGVTVTSSSGQPGSPGVNILVRGVNTINSQTNPLILIDGIAGGDINLVNPDDIESVTVLKDAASSAIYGARAANGVILITTKKGKKEGKTAFSYSGYFGIQRPVSLPELVNGRQFMTLENEARAARGVAIPYSDEAFMKYDSKNFPNDYSNTNWIDATFKDHATQQSHNINLNGSSNHTTYYMSYGFLQQDGLIVGDPYSSNRHNVRLRLESQIIDRLKVDGNISFINFYKQDAGGSGTSG
ncbi:MAG: SusC/RagA family TonB-linked outer membrane protein, partial [Proteiniphilum sp.]